MQAGAMDSLRAIDDAPTAFADDPPAMEPPPLIGNDERRMQVRAYNHWVSMLGGRDYPSVEDLEPDKLGDFGPHGVLLDFTGGAENPGISFIGTALQVECALPGGLTQVAQVPKRSLLSRLTDHYLQIIANRAPIGFEAEFVNGYGVTTLYRGILMPLSSDGDTIDFIYGVINWKELADAATQARLGSTVDAALGVAGHPPHSPVWADGPSAEPEAARPAPKLTLVADRDADEVFDELDLPHTPLPQDAELGDRLLVARESADAVKAADGRSRSALYRALGQAYDFAVATEAHPEEYRELLEDAGVKRQDRAPMTPVVKLVFGADYDKARVTEFAAALAHGRRQAIGSGAFARYLEAQPGGLKALVAAERAHRRPQTPKRDMAAQARAALLAAPALARLPNLGGADEFELLVARREPDGTLAVVALAADGALATRAMQAAARAV